MSTVIDSRTTLVALQGLRNANTDVARASERLSTGLRVNSAADDPAGVGKAATLKAEIGSYQQVKRNVNTALSDLGSVTDGLMSISDYLVEMRTIAVAAKSESDSTVRATYQAAFTELRQGITDIVTNTKFAGVSILNTGAAQSVQIGINAADVKTFTVSATTPAVLAISASTVATSAGAGSAIAAVESAIDTVAGRLAKVGGIQNSLEYSLDLADNEILSKSSQYGNIMNADIALEATNLAAAKIRQDSATAVLAQANSMNRNIADYLLNGALG